jgi:hypothetical membrane protein
MMIRLQQNFYWTGVRMKKGQLFGVLGVGLISLSMVISALFYEGRSGERFSILNHFVSELGEYPWSSSAWVFNYGLILGGIFVLIFMISLWSIFDGWLGKLIVIVGVVTSISGSLVGVYPMNNLDPHIDVAMTFFYAGLLITILFSGYVFTRQNEKFPKWMAIPGSVSGICFFIFLFFTDPIVPAGTPVEAMFSVLENRPQILETAIFEWAVILSTMVWIFILSVYVYKSPTLVFHKFKQEIS